MITWMQRHKKYLVITIWISVIAFVGAGFVGWGAYDFNSDRASAVAKVGDRKITVQEYQIAYANYYSFYNNMLGGGLTQEKADEMGLEKIVMQSIINDTLILAYADEIALRTTDDEIKTILTNDKAFQKDGVFDKDTYYNTLKQSRMKAKDYEKGLERQILITKVRKVLKLKPTKSEKEIFSSSMFMKDRLAVGIVSLSMSEAVVSEDEIKSYWEKHKGQYLSEKSYDIDTITIGLSTKAIDEDKLKEYYESKKYNYKSDDGKIVSLEDARVDVERDYRLKLSKRGALETYLLFKKSQINATDSKTIKASDTTFPVKKLITLNVTEVLKPIKTKDGYMVVKLTRINKPAPKPYKDAKESILVKLQSDKKITALEQKAEAMLTVFKGIDIGFVSREGGKKIAGLSESESLEFINSVFDSNKARNYSIIGNKAVLYQILEQNLLTDSSVEKYTTLVNDNIVQMKQAEIGQNLIVNLKKRYDIEQYYKGN